MKLLSCVFLLCAACPPSPTPPSPDASDAALIPPAPLPMMDAMAGDLGTQVCNHLAAIGCAQLATCADVLNKDQGVVTNFKPACLLAATSATQAAACKTIACPVTVTVHPHSP